MRKQLALATILLAISATLLWAHDLLWATLTFQVR